MTTRTHTPQTAAALPLAGITIVDMTSAVVGPYATQILADYGAEVVKIEERTGDIIRWISGRSPTPGMSGKFMHMNRNKRSISLDLKSPQGIEAVRRLVARSDVFLHNMRPAAIDRLGLTFDKLKPLNDRLIYCGIVGFGQGGRYKDRPAYDSILQGGTGLASLFAYHGGEPRYVPFVVVDRMAGLMVTHALLAALFARQADGSAREIEIPMFESFAAMLMSEHMYGSSFDPPVSPPGDARLLDPNAKPVATLDGYLCITTNTDAQVFKLFEAFGRPELRDDPRFCNANSRIDHIADFFAIRAAELKRRTTAEWLEVLGDLDIPCMPCHTLESLLADEHIKDVGLFTSALHPTQGKTWDINVPIRMTGFEPSVRRAAPMLGEHTREVLLQLGFEPAQVDDMFLNNAAYDATAR
jgi:crotonobetainyl-CoA:carnitine CoA-transferase CaiB-like acyl-CoA transferase